MEHARLVVALAGVLAAGLGAQSNSFLLPSVATDLNTSPTATTNGGAADTVSFWFSGAPVQPVRIQHLWPTSDVPIPGGVLQALAFRRANATGNGPNPAATANLTVALSVGPNTVAGYSQVFANNRGALPVTVFGGTLNLPADPVGVGPGQFLATIPFATPFPFGTATGNTLVAELLVTSYATASNASWTLDAVGIDAGLRTTNFYAPNCRFSNNALNNSISHRNPVLGGSWFLSYQGSLPTGLAAVGCLGFRGVGNHWNGIPLPIDLGPLGAPGCFFATSIAIMVPLTEVAAGSYHWPTVPIPMDPLLYDQSFFDQGLFVDPQANALGLVPSWSSQWTVRSGNRPLGGMLYQFTQNGTPFPSPTTGYWTDLATVARFSY